MKAELRILFDDRVLDTAAERFGLGRTTLRRLDSFENVVLEATRDGLSCILRISHNSHRTLDQVQAELDWLDYLARNGISVSIPLRSRQDLLVERLEENGETFIAVVFERARGGFVRKDDWTPQMTFNRGRLLGRMHALTKGYEPPSGKIRRHAWYEEDDFVSYRNYLRPGDEIVAERFAELQAALRAIPIDRESWGLIHMDPHTGNMFFDDDHPTLFDFDDCSYDFFVSDIAISLFYAVLMHPEDSRQAFGRDFLHTLLKGYRTENRLDNRWRDVIPLILKRREILLYVAIHHGYNEVDFDEWCRRYLDGRRERIRDRAPYLDMDWSEFDLAGG